MNLIAKKSFPYGSRRLRAGDSFEASNRDGRLLVLIGRADIPKPAKEPPKVEVDPLDELRAEAEALGVAVDRRWREARLRDEIGRTRYMTRDMRAEE